MSNQQSQSRAVALTKDQLVQEIVLAKPTIEKMLPKHLTFEHFEGMVVNVVAGNPKLMECHQGSLLRAVINSADVGLSLNPIMREADILPVWSSNGPVAQFRPRAIGMMKLARQSGEVIKIAAHEVCENDDFDVEYGIEEKLTHRPPKLGKDRGPIIGAYCVWTLKSGVTQFEVLDRARIDRARASSESYKYALQNNKTNSVWHIHEGEMVRKTAIRAASKYMPMSTENDPFLKALEYDRDDDNVVDGTFSEAADNAPAGPQSGATSVASLESRMGVGAGASAGESGATTLGTPSPNQNQQQALGQTTAPAAAASPGATASSASQPPSDTSNQGSAQNGGATTASRSRARKDKPAPAAQPPASEQDGPLGDNPPPPEDGPQPGRVTPPSNAPMQDLPGDDWGDEPPAVVVDWPATARRWRGELDGPFTQESFKKWLDDNRPMRERMKAEAPDWYDKVMKIVIRQEAYLRGNSA